MSTKINEKSNQINKNKALSKDMAIYVLYLLLLLLPQYFKGGYFQDIYLPFILGISVLMIYHICKEYRGSRNILVNDETDLLLVLLIIIYSLTFFYGINKRGSIIEFIKNASYLSVFFIARDIHKKNGIRNRTLNFIILSGVILSIIGVGTMIGTWDYSASFSGTRLSSTFQYPNTLAVYVAAMYFLTMGQVLMNEDPKKVGLYGGGLFVFFSTLIFTYSRGMWVLFPILLLVFFIILAGNKKVQLFFYSLVSIIISAPLSFLFLKYIESGNPTKLWGLYFAGIILSALVSFLLGNATKLLSKVSWKTVVVIVIIIAIGASGLLFMAIKATEPLAYDNPTDEKIVSQLSRTIEDVFSNTDYELNVKGSAALQGEENFAGRILVYSVNEQIKYTSLGTYNIEENGEFDLDISITTLEDTNAIVVRFRNENPKTSITFNEASIKDLETEEIKEIPLKYKYIPEAIISRITGIGTTDNSLQARIMFSKDALKLVKNRFLFGMGGEGWATAYRSVQSYPYWSKQVHNHYLQLFVEVGLLGTILFIGFLLSLIYKYFKYKKSEEDINNRTLVDTLVISIGTILTHAAMDFDLSLVGLTIILWALMGILQSIVSTPKDEINLGKLSLSRKLLKKVNVPVTILTLIAILLSSTLYGGILFTKKVVKAQEMGDTDGMEAAMEKAVLLDPFNTAYKTDLIDIYFFQYEAKSDQSYGNKAKETTDKLLKYGKHDPLVYIKGTEVYFKFGFIDEGLAMINKSLEMQPFVIESYIQNADAHLSIFNYHLQQGNLENARIVANEGYSNIENLLLESNQRSLRPMAKNNKLFYQLSELKYYANEFDDFISYFERAYRLKYYYDFNLDVDGDDKIELVSMWNAEGGNLGYGRNKDEEFVKLNNSGEKYGVFDVLSFNLEPEKTYLVTFDARGDMTSDKATFYIMDTKSQERLQTPSTPIELGSQWNTYEIEFTTQGDIGEDTSRARFIIGGENNGDLDLRNIKIFEKLN